MSYFAEPQLEKINLSDEYWVEIKKDLKYGDVKNFVSVNADGRVDQSAALDTFLLSVLVNWNLDDGDTVAPIDQAHINLLSQKDAVAIIEAAGQAIAGDKEDKAVFLDKSDPSLTPAK